MTADAAKPCGHNHTHDHSQDHTHAGTVVGAAEHAKVAPAVSLRNVSFSYAETPVLQDVTLTIPRHELACLIGPNGGGKTTLFNLILGLLRPDRGEITVLEQPPKKARGRVGYVPQHFHFDPQFPIRVEDVVQMGCLGPDWWFGPPKAEARERVTRALADMGMSDLRRRAFRALSGGQRQRVLIARALASDPELLLLDEPTANVDPLAEEDIVEHLDLLARRLTVVMITHRVHTVSHFLKNLVCVNRTVHVHPATERLDAHVLEHMFGKVCAVSTAAAPQPLDAAKGTS